MCTEKCIFWISSITDNRVYHIAHICPHLDLNQNYNHFVVDLKASKGHFLQSGKKETKCKFIDLDIIKKNGLPICGSSGKNLLNECPAVQFCKTIRAVSLFSSASISSFSSGLQKYVCSSLTRFALVEVCCNVPDVVEYVDDEDSVGEGVSKREYCLADSVSGFVVLQRP